MEMFWQAGGNEDVVIRHAPARAEHSPAGSQHGELGDYSSKGICVNNGVERSVAEGKRGSCSKSEMTATGQSEIFRARVCSSYGGARYVGDDSPASASFREVQPWPAASGADIEQASSGLQIQYPNEVFGLRHRGVAVCPNYGANRFLLHAIECWRSAN